MSPRRADPVLTERRRDTLIRAGYADILEKGVHALTLESVVARAGLSKGGALHYFPNREALIVAVLEWLIAQLSRTLDEVVRTHETPRARLAAEIEVLFHSAEVNRKLYLMLLDFASTGSRVEKYRAPLAKFFEKCRARDRGIIVEGIRAHEFRRVDPDSAASTIRALVDGYCLQWLMSGEAVSLEVYRDRCRAVVGAYLLR